MKSFKLLPVSAAVLSVLAANAVLKLLQQMQ